MSIKHTKILFAVLNWGLGHATRSIPLITKLMKDDNEVILASSGASLLLLKSEFPENLFIELPDYAINYKSDNMLVNALLQFNKVSKAIKKEHDFILDYLKNSDIELVISDNRYGIYSEEVKSILITHQLKLRMPKGFGFLKFLAQKKNYKYISRFNEVWVPDYEGDNNLSGALSHESKLPVPIKFIGPQSRFKKKYSLPKKYDLAFIISGPEPARSNFENQIRKELENYKGNAALVLGQIEGKVQNKSNIDVFNHLNNNDLQDLILSSEIVVCRSGYSSIMDMSALGVKAIIIPTAGQTEQEYLAEYHKNKGNFIALLQKEFTLHKVLCNIEEISFH